MSNWYTKKLGDVAKIAASNVDKIIYDDEIKVKLCNYMDVYNGSYIESSVRMSDGSATQRELDDYCLCKGQVLLTKDSETPEDIARSAYVSRDFDDVVCGYHLAIITPGQELDGRFLKRLFDEPKYQNYFSRLANGVTRFGITQPSIQKASISFPGKPEQQRIVSVLETWDDYLELLDKKIALKERLKKGLMQQLLTGKKRLPGFSDEWKIHKLSDIALLRKGVGLSKDSLTKNGTKCVLYGEIYTKYDYYIDEITSRTMTSAGTESVLGDIIIPASTTTSNLDVATATVVNESGVLLGGDINILRPKTGIDSAFLSFMLNTVKKHDLAKLAQGVTIIHLYGKDILKSKVELPGYEEQLSIAKVLLKLRKEIKLMNDEKRLLRCQKKYLLKNLITGKIRTPEDLKIKEVGNA